MRRVTAQLLGAVMTAAALTSPTPAASAAEPCSNPDPLPRLLRDARVSRFTEEPRAGTWQTFTVPVAAARVAVPPAIASGQHASELAQVKLKTTTRTPAEEQAALKWGTNQPVGPWTEELLKQVKSHSSKPGYNPPRLARMIGMYQTTLYDALVAAWAAKYCYLRPPPSQMNPAIDTIGDVPAAPSYPSEHATVAAAASAMLTEFFPDVAASTFDSMGWQAAQSRVVAGASYPTDVSAGWTLGRDVARAAVADRVGDGSDAVWDGTGRVTGPCNWEPTPPAFQDAPLEPLWGEVRPFVLSSGDQFRPAPPPDCDGPEYTAALSDLHHATAQLTDRQKQIATYWAGGGGTETPPGMNLRLAAEAAGSRPLNCMRHARVLAYVGAGLADAGIAAWDAKYAYWWDRPVTAIHRLGIDPDWESYLTTPPFPGYVSGHSSFSGTTSRILGGFFPSDAQLFSALATEAAMSRFYGGIHVRYDNEPGLELGWDIGDEVLRVASLDGAS